MLLILVLKRDDTHDRTVLVGCFVWHYMFFLIWTWMQNLGKFILLHMCNCYETNIFISMNVHVYTFYQCNLYKTNLASCICDLNWIFVHGYLILNRTFCIHVIISTQFFVSFYRFLVVFFKYTFPLWYIDV